KGWQTMNGAESLVRTLVGGGVNVCFTNPGTSEMHFVAALDKVEGMRCVLALFEGVVTGAADGYWRMRDRRAATLMHLGPGLGNAGWNHGSGPVKVPTMPTRTPVAEDAVKQAARVLAQGAGTMLLLSGEGVHERGLALAGAIAKKTGARLLAQGSNARVQREA